MPELRKDPVVGQWVIMATERSRRPSDFVKNREERKGGPCVFCAGMEHLTPAEVLSYRAAGTAPNQPGWRVRGVPNKFPALRIEGGAGNRDGRRKRHGILPCPDVGPRLDIWKLNDKLSFS